MSEIVAWGGRSFGVSNVIVLGTPSSTKGGAIVTCADAAAGTTSASSAARSGPPHGRPRCRAITIRWTSFVPSPISRIFWSR